MHYFPSYPGNCSLSIYPPFCPKISKILVAHISQIQALLPSHQNPEKSPLSLGDMFVCLVRLSFPEREKKNARRRNNLIQKEWQRFVGNGVHQEQRDLQNRHRGRFFFTAGGSVGLQTLCNISGEKHGWYIYIYVYMYILFLLLMQFFTAWEEIQFSVVIALQFQP